ncbi:hypothetical protein NM208_g624 [Fusarium decemcellulare]|uniref:Uncharacterized protein n=1 Tax=Fusarium decemcellulare TaxID=57161 RepID=A0ACC1SZ57_9HYPO|nr:hypothetical protein NM208_g624 [Fusarium decemcellulare]
MPSSTLFEDLEPGRREDSKQKRQVPKARIAMSTVSFDGPEDPLHPYNWSRPKKIAFVAIVTAKIFAVSFASSIFGSASSVLTQEYDVSSVVVQLGVALFVAGFAVGPLVFGSLSELVGNRPPMVFGCALCALLQIPLALINNIAGILFCRFLAGMLGSAVLGVGTGMVAELYEPVSRAAALAFSASMINVGSTVAPITGSYVVERYGWRWTAWVAVNFNKDNRDVNLSIRSQCIFIMFCP